MEYIGTSDEILTTLVRGYEEQEICHNTSNMLRECLVYETLAKIVLQSENFNDLFKYIQVSQPIRVIILLTNHCSGSSV